MPNERVPVGVQLSVEDLVYEVLHFPDYEREHVVAALALLSADDLSALHLTLGRLKNWAWYAILQQGIADAE